MKEFLRIFKETDCSFK